jgi:phosphatidylglycerol---prolipoprotein diacylglyceryl transferase
VHPVALQFGPFTIYWYGVFIALGFILGLWTASRRAPQANLASERIADLGPWLVIGSILGARIWYVVTYWQESFAQQPFWEIFMIQHGGLVFYGGLAGGMAGGYLGVKKMGLPFWATADVLAPGIALGHVFGRIGCLMNGCCYGYPTHCSWAVRFPATHATGGVPVHPTELYEALLDLGLALGLAWFFRRRKRDGQVFAAYLILYALVRFFVEFYRGDYTVYYLHGLLSPGQVLSCVVFLAGLITWVWVNRRSSVSPEL